MRVSVDEGLQSLLGLLKLIIHEIGLRKVKLGFNITMSAREFL